MAKTLREQRATIVPSKPRVFSLKEVSSHADQSSCWIVIKDGVYDVTNFVAEHPGGSEIMLEHTGHLVVVRPVLDGVKSTLDVTRLPSWHDLGYGSVIHVFPGLDATTVFQDIGHSAEAVKILSKYYIGELAEEDRIYNSKPGV